MTLILSGTDGLSDVDGSAATPAIRGTDANTGIFFPAADTIAFSEGGAEIARFDSSGNLGIGTASPAARLDVSSTGLSANFGSSTAFAGALWKSSTTTGLGRYVAAEADAMTFGRYGVTEHMRIDSSGNVGIGTSSPSAKLDVNGNIAGGSVNVFGTSTPANGINNVTTNALGFFTNSTERMRIDSSGNLLVGTTSASASIGVGIKNVYSATDPFISVVAAGSTSATNAILVYSTGAAAYRFYVGLDGRVNATLTTISAISDERLKENIKDLDFGIAEIMALKPRRYDWKEGKGANTKDAVGFIAQEFETVFPASVGTSMAGEDGIEYKNICHEELIPTLVKAIQEMKAIIDTQASTITQLQADVEALKGTP